MIELTIGNSYSKISGLTPSQHSELRKILSYSLPPKKAYFAGMGGFRRYLIDKKGNFPTGLLHLVMNWIVEANMDPPRIADTRVQPASPPGGFWVDLPVTPYSEQIDAVEAAIYEHQGIITMPTGYGKSMTMAILVQQLGLRTLIVVPNLGLKTQLSESFEKIFGKNSNIVIENIDSPKLKNLKDFDCLIIDEAHHAAAETYRKLNKTAWTGIYYRFFFTATPYRSRNEETILMECITGRVIYSVTYKQAVEAGVIVPVEAYYVDVPAKETDGHTWQQVYKDLVVKNDRRNDIIANIVTRLQANQVSTLCLVKEVDHGGTLQLLCNTSFAHGENENTSALIEEFNDRRIYDLIGTVGVLGEGIDTKPAEYVLIAGLGKSKPQLMQQIGRGVRKYPGKTSCKVILFRDKSHKWTLTHFKEQCKVLKEEYGVIPVKLEV